MQLTRQMCIRDSNELMELQEGEIVIFRRSKRRDLKGNKIKPRPIFNSVESGRYFWDLDHYEMGLAAAKINSFIWDVYCDWFIEIAKPRLNSGDAEQADTARRVLVYVLDKALKLLHPFMPFITEELYQALPGSAETIMTQEWPTVDESHNWAEEEEAFEKVMDYIKAVRTMRTEMNVHPAKKTSMIIETADPAPFQSQLNFAFSFIVIP